MISPYVVAARLACHLDTAAAGVPGYALPAIGTAIQRRMGPNLFACAGVSIAITNVQAVPSPPNCEPPARYTVDAAIARACAVEFNREGQTMNREADTIAQTLSLDAAALWQAFSTYAPLIAFQITGGIGVTSASFSTTEFDAPFCVYPETPPVLMAEPMRV